MPPALIVKGTEALKTLAPFKVTTPLLMITPPVAAKVANHSGPAVMVLSYCKVAEAP